MNIKILIAAYICTSIILGQASEAWPAKRNFQTDIRNDNPAWHESDSRSDRSPKYPDHRVGATTSSSFYTPNIQLADIKQPEWVRQYGSKMAPSDDAVVGMKVDSQGNSIVTGYRSVYEGGTEWYTIKYDPDGNELWGKALAGAVYRDHKPMAIVVDDAGEIFVTGVTYDTKTDAQWTTVKYDASGNEIWRQDYNSPGIERDIGQQITVDANGSVYVAGESALSYDEAYVAIKYNRLGEQQWIAQYIDKVIGWYGSVKVRDIAVDSQGSLILTGGQIEGDDYWEGIHSPWITVKFDSAGQKIWVAEYDDGDPDRNRNVEAMTIDDAGNIYVTGEGACNAIMTICYSPQGTEVWRSENRLDNAEECGESGAEGKDIEIDGDGNIIVVGFGDIGGGYNWGTVLLNYTPDGQLQWTANYTGGEDEFGVEPVGIMIGADGAVNIAAQSHNRNRGPGYSISIAKFGGSGDLEWSTSYDGDGQYVRNSPVGIGVDGAGNVIVSGLSYDNWGFSFRDYVTLKYSSTGDRLWDARYDGETVSADQPVDVINDDAGNAYVLVNSMKGNHWQQDAQIIKYGADGEEQWIANYGDAEFDYYAVSLDIDIERNIIILISASRGSDYTSKFVTASFNEDGALRWEQEFLNDGNQFPKRVIADRKGNVYVFGEATRAETRRDLVLIKYDKTGTEQWISWYDGPGESWENAHDMVIDDAGNLYVSQTGIQRNEMAVQILKYNSDGVHKWTRGISFDYSTHNLGYRNITLDPEGRPILLVTIDAYSEKRRYDCLVKYSSGGKKIWRKELGEYGWAYRFLNDPFGSIYVFGGRYNYSRVQKISAGGGLIWEDSTGHLATGFGGVDGLGNIILGSQYSYETGDKGIAVAKIDPDGQHVWTDLYSNPNGIDENLRMMTVDIDGNAYLVSSQQSGEITILKYAADDDLPDVLPGKMSYACPNPFNSRVGIVYDVAKPGKVGLKIYNLLGQEVASLVDWRQSPGTYRVYWTPAYRPSGIYFYQLQVGRKIESKKMVYLK